jgi:hypothetical protein
MKNRQVFYVEIYLIVFEFGGSDGWRRELIYAPDGIKYL